MENQKGSCNHVSFVDEHMENYDMESSALHRKLQSKVEALKIMRSELERYRNERDQFKLMAETLQLRYSAIKNSLENFDYNDLRFGEGSSVGILLNQTREKNINLNTEVEAMREKLDELQGDMKILRSKNIDLQNKLKFTNSKNNASTDEAQLAEWHEEKSKYISQMEQLKKKNAQLQFDVRALLDEKEEIITERDAFKCKVHRLNHELNAVLKGNDAQLKTIDIDALILESKFLMERVENLEGELELAKQSASKYKTMLDSKRTKGIIKLGANSNNEMIMSHRQVKKLLEEGTISEIPLKAATISDLKSLCLALLDNLNDKNLALSHQKKTNRLLAAKISDLEQKINVISGNTSKTTLMSPSQILLNGYTSSKVDADCRTSNSAKDDHQHLKVATNFESSESNKSLLSSEYEERSISDVSSEYNNNFNYHNINVIADGDLYEDDEIGIDEVDIEKDKMENESKLAELPPEIAKLVAEAMKNAHDQSAASENSQHSENVTH